MNTWHPGAMAVTFVIAVFVTILALNFTAGEKKIKQHLEHHYDVADSQFLRSMGVPRNCGRRPYRYSIRNGNCRQPLH